MGGRAAPGVSAAGPGVAHHVWQAEIAQCDWFPPIELPVGTGPNCTAKQLPVLTMVCIFALAVGDAAQQVCRGPVRPAVAADRGVEAVPRVLVWDGEGAIGRWRGGAVRLTAECQAFPRRWRPRCSSATTGCDPGQGPR